MKEVRYFENVEFRIQPESRKIEGYALLFDVESRDLGGFTEIIDKKSLEGVLEKSDVLALFNHDENRVLARNTGGEGTLELNIDENGLKYSFEAPNTSTGEELLDAIKRGDLRNSSFAFTLPENGAKWEKRGSKYLRTIVKFDQLHDVSPVWRPAYSDTSVALRGLNDYMNDEVKPSEINTRDEGDKELVKAKIEDNEYMIPKERIVDIIERTDKERKLNEYFNGLSGEIIKLKNN